MLGICGGKTFKWIDLYEAIGIKNMVFHCDNLAGEKLSKVEKTQRNVEKLMEVAKYAKGRDIIICIENFRPHFEGEELIERTVDDWLGIIDATVNFEEVVKALSEIDYKGIFNLEIPGKAWYAP